MPVADMAQVCTRFGVASLLAETAHLGTGDVMQFLHGVFVENGDVCQIGIKEKQAERDSNGHEPIIPAVILPLDAVQDDGEYG